MPQVLEVLSFISFDYFTTESARLFRSFLSGDCSLRTVNSFKGICGLWQGEHSKMPEANYLLSVSWGYIKVGSFDCYVSLTECEAFTAVCFL